VLRQPVTPAQQRRGLPAIPRTTVPQTVRPAAARVTKPPAEPLRAMLPAAVPLRMALAMPPTQARVQA
jgi:hypothetical protein